MKKPVRIPVLRPHLPAAAELTPYLQRIDEARYYSNHGPLTAEFESRLARHFAVDESHLVTVCNGTAALTAALLALDAAPGAKCLMPAWTFVASAAAAWAAFFQPHFIDVKPESWMIEPQAIRSMGDLRNVGAIMPVSAFGAPVDVPAWDEFSAETDIPVIIDCAGAFDAVSTVAQSHCGRSAMMISFHATKAFGIGEGAAIISRDESLIERIREVCNFGFQSTAEAQHRGINAKLSEYHAAIGLAALDRWQSRRNQLLGLTHCYLEEIARTRGISPMPGYGGGWVSSYCNVITKRSARESEKLLDEAGIEYRRWWRDGVHLQPAYASVPREELPVTANLAEHVVGLPFYHDLAHSDAAAIVSVIGEDM